MSNFPSGCSKTTKWVTESTNGCSKTTKRVTESTNGDPISTKWGAPTIWVKLGFIVKFNNVIVVWFGLHPWQVLNANTLDRLIHKTRQQARENNATFTLADVLLVLDISKNNDANEK